MRARRAAVIVAVLAMIGCEDRGAEKAVEPGKRPAADTVKPQPIPPKVEPVAPKPKPPVVEEPPAPSPPEPKTLKASPAMPGVPRDALRYQRDLIGNARVVWGMNGPIATFAGQVHQESTWKADARSRTGAAGLAQFMPRTADWISGLYHDELGTNEPLNPAWALRALVRYDKLLRDGVKISDSECDRIMFALSDYNGGAGWRIKRQKLSPRPGNYETTSKINPGITEGNQRENQEYAGRIVRRWQPLYLSWGLGSCT